MTVSCCLSSLKEFVGGHSDKFSHVICFIITFSISIFYSNKNVQDLLKAWQLFSTNLNETIEKAKVCTSGGFGGNAHRGTT